MSKRKHAQISGYTFDSALKTIQNINRHSTKGDWRQNTWQEWRGWGRGGSSVTRG